MKIISGHEALACFYKTYPKVKILDKAEWTPGWVNSKAVIGFMVYRPNGQEGWIVDENGAIWEPQSFQTNPNPPSFGSPGHSARSHD